MGVKLRRELRDKFPLANNPPSVLCLQEPGRENGRTQGDRMHREIPENVKSYSLKTTISTMAEPGVGTLLVPPKPVCLGSSARIRLFPVSGPGESQREGSS